MRLLIFPKSIEKYHKTLFLSENSNLSNVIMLSKVEKTKIKLFKINIINNELIIILIALS